MRQIKFRAWDGERMFHLGDNLTDTILFGFDRQTGQMNKVQIGEADYDWDVIGYNWYGGIPGSLLTLMQFTGLSDKAGLPIYEGDIVNLSYCGDHKTEDFIIKWNESTARFILLDMQGHEWSYGQRNDVAVIGNIYENPGLLTP